MSMERQPARLATINLRMVLDSMNETVDTKKEKPMGLLSSRIQPPSFMQDENSEASRTLNYMKQIREAMSDGV